MPSPRLYTARDLSRLSAEHGAEVSARTFRRMLARWYARGVPGVIRDTVQGGTAYALTEDGLRTLLPVLAGVVGGELRRAA